MAGQPLVITFNTAVDETALKCGDPFYKDFPKYIYQQAIYRSERSIAHDYSILDRILYITNGSGLSPRTINIGLPASNTPLNFSGDVWRLTVTPSGGMEMEFQLRTIDEVLDNNLSPTASSNYFYAIVYNTNNYYLYYTHPAVNDYITIFYAANIAGQEDYEPFGPEDIPNVLPALPNKYFEETVRRSVRYMAQLGIGKYEFGQKFERYSRLLTIYTRRADNAEDYNLERDRAWISIKPFQYP